MISNKQKRYVFISLFLFCILSGCKKNNPSTSTPPIVSFKADGVTYSYTGDWDFNSFTGCSVDSLFINTLGYFILAGVRTSNSDGFEADVTTSFVELKTYTNVKFEAVLNQVHYLESYDALLTISKIENGRANGTFSGKIATYPNGTKVNITEGVFTNVQFR